MIRQKINIPKKSYKDIIIGKNNIVINKIKNMAQKKMQMFFDNQKIDLDLQVKLFKIKIIHIFFHYRIAVTMSISLYIGAYNRLFVAFSYLKSLSIGRLNPNPI